MHVVAALCAPYSRRYHVPGFPITYPHFFRILIGKHTETNDSCVESSQPRKSLNQGLVCGLLVRGFRFEIVCSIHRKNADFHFFHNPLMSSSTLIMKWWVFSYFILSDCSIVVQKEQHVTSSGPVSAPTRLATQPEEWNTPAKPVTLGDLGALLPWMHALFCATHWMSKFSFCFLCVAFFPWYCHPLCLETSEFCQHDPL